MAISGITTNFIKNKGIDFVSQLANNSDSIAPMVMKDALSNSAIVYTYSKEGTKDDVREKFIEEFGTGAVWLLMIPGIKKLADKTVYPFLKLNPDLDCEAVISNEDIKNETIQKTKLKEAGSIKKTITNFFDTGINKKTTKEIQENILKNSTNSALANEKQIFATLNDKNEVIKNLFEKLKIQGKNVPTNAQMYKGLKVGKFLVSTGLSAFALVKIIKFKQKTTQDRIERDFKNKKSSSKILLDKDLDKDEFYQNFTNKIKPKSSSLAFEGLGAFMTNPILNTMILDGVITTTRLTEARKGEVKEVALKEIFQLLFIYCLAKPIQMFFETIGKKINMPIELDPKVLFDKNLKEKVAQSKDKIKEIKTGEKNIVKELYSMDSNHALIELLEKNGVLKTVEKDGDKAISFLKPVKEKEVLKTFDNIEKLSENMGNLAKIKGYKVFSVFANVLIAALATGILQPKITIWMRKLLNHGDNRNPAIVEKEKQMYNSSSA